MDDLKLPVGLVIVSMLIGVLIGLYFGIQFQWSVEAHDLLNRDLVQSGDLKPQAAVNSSDGGNKEFQNVTVNYLRGDLEHALTVTGFVNHDVFARFADFVRTRPVAAAYYRQALAQWIRGLERGAERKAAKPELPIEVVENLKALGYVR